MRCSCGFVVRACPRCGTPLLSDGSLLQEAQAVRIAHGGPPLAGRLLGEVEYMAPETLKEAARGSLKVRTPTLRVMRAYAQTRQRCDALQEALDALPGRPDRLKAAQVHDQPTSVTTYSSRTLVSSSTLDVTAGTLAPVVCGSFPTPLSVFGLRRMLLALAHLAIELIEVFRLAAWSSKKPISFTFGFLVATCLHHIELISYVLFKLYFRIAWLFFTAPFKAGGMLFAEAMSGGLQELSVASRDVSSAFSFLSTSVLPYFQPLNNFLTDYIFPFCF